MNKMTPEERLASKKAGGAKARATIYARYGADYFKRMGKSGGQAGTGHAFGHNKVDPRVAGRLGGTISKRKPAVK